MGETLKSILAGFQETKFKLENFIARTNNENTAIDEDNIELEAKIEENIKTIKSNNEEIKKAKKVITQVKKFIVE